MAGRVNTKFVIILSAVLLLLIGGAVGFVKFYVHKSAGELEAIGDQHLVLAQNLVIDPSAEADEIARIQSERGKSFRLAAENYGQAWNKDPQNVDLLLKYLEARRNMIIDNPRDAQRVIEEIYRLTRQATELRPNDDQLLEDFYQMLYGWSQRYNAPSFIRDIYDLTSKRLESYPNNIVATKFKAMAMTRRMSTDMDRGIQQEARAELEKVLAQRPDDTDVLHHLALWHLFEARRLQLSGADPDVVQKPIDTALEYSVKAAALKPNDGQVTIERIQVLLHPMVRDLDQARPLLEGLEAYLLGNPDPPMVVQRVAELLPMLDTAVPEDKPEGVITTVGIERSERLLRTASEARPEMLLYRLMLANLLKRQLKLDEAHAYYVDSRDYNIQGNAESSMLDESLRQQAVYEVANIELIRAENAADSENRTKILLDADKAVDDLEAVTGEDHRVHLLRGKIALLRGENTKAMQQIDKACALTGERDVEALLLSARARQAERQWGSAAERLERVLMVIGSSSRQDISDNIRLQLAEMRLRSRKFKEARDQIEAVLEREPNNLTALRLKSQWFASMERYDEAITILETIGVEEHPEIARSLAQLYSAAGQSERANSMLLAELDKDPANVSLLQQALALTPDTDEKLALIDRAAAAGASGGATDVLRMQVQGSGSLDIDEMVERLTGEADNELDQAIRRAQLYLQANQPDKAHAAFEEAQKLAPEDDRVVIMAMDFAINDGDFKLAQRLAENAGRKNLDLARGNFLRGKLAAAEGNLKQALASFDLGLKERPVFDEGWRQYGDLLMRSGDAESASNAYNTALDQRPDNVRALTGLAIADDFLGRRLQALESLRVATQYAPQDAALRNRYLAYEERNGDPRVAIRFRQDLHDANPSDAGNTASLAMLMARQGQHDQALSLLGEIEQTPENARELVAARSSVQLASGDSAAGRKTIEDYIASQGDQADVQDHLMLARYLVSAGQATESLDAYQSAIATEDPQARPASRELADVLFNYGQTAQALTIYRELYDQAEADQRQVLGLRLVETLLRSENTDEAETIVNQLEPDATADALRSVIARQRGNSDKALELINRSLTKDSQNALTYVQRADLLATDPENYDEALADLDKALGINANLVQAMALKANMQTRMGRVPDAIRTLRNLLTAAPGNNEARLQLAQLQMQQGNAASAADLVADGLKLNPENPAWLQLDANLSASSGDLDRAMTNLEKLVELQPAPGTVGQLCALYLQAERAAPAEALLNEHPQLLAQSPALQALRGQAMAAQGRTEEAKRVFALAFERSTDRGSMEQVIQRMATAFGPAEAIPLIESFDAPAQPSWRDMAIVRICLNNQDFAAALERLSTLRNTLPKSDKAGLAQVERLEALCRYQTKDFKGARDAYQRILDADPNNVEVLNNLAYLLANDLDDPKAAVPMAEQAAKIASSNAEVLDTLGWTYYQVGRMSDARLTLESSVRANPLPANTYHLGRVYLDLELSERARTYLDQSLDLCKQAGDEDTAENVRRYLQRLSR